MRHARFTRDRVTAAALLVAALAALPVAAQPPGDAARGREVFAGKHCARCHRPGGQPGAGPALEQLRRPQGAYALTGRLWNHAPAMFTALTQERLAWPAISVAEMGDLMAYLDADPRRDPAPDLGKGQLALVGKGCLKCHGFRREGGRLGPDLAERRASYAPPARAVNVTVLGETGRPPLLRSTARPGDVVAVTGALGRSAAGLALLEHPDAARGLTAEAREDATGAHLRPLPRVREGQWLLSCCGELATEDA